MITSYIEFKTYLRALVTSSTEVQTFKTGNITIVEESTRNLNKETEYPLMWMEVPDTMSRIQDGNPIDPVSCAFAILAPCNKLSHDQEEALVDSLFLIAKEVANKMKKDYYSTQDPPLATEIPFKFEAVAPLTSSSLIGWRVEFGLNLITDNCIDPAKWL